MESPKTFHGYDEDDDCIATETAEDANNYLNPEEVKAALAKLEAVLKEQFKGIVDALRAIEQDANEAVIVQGTKMGGTIEEVCNALDSVPDTILSQIGDLYSLAVTKHDEIQRELNDTAYNSTASTSGVVRVS